MSSTSLAFSDEGFTANGVIVSSDPTLMSPVSQACTQSQIASETFKHWCSQLKIEPVPHRKNWEWCYILQALNVRGLLSSGRRGLGFGVGAEPLADYFASRGCLVTATDQAADKAKAEGWADTNQHASQRQQLRQGYASDAQFENVIFGVVDMNNIPNDLKDYDFTWSACCLEHLGSLANGLEFIERSLDTLKPGGVAVHTTELNCSSNEETIDNDWCVLYRKKDIAAFADKLNAKGHEITLNFNLGTLPNDYFVDVPPYAHNPHLKLRLGQYTTTSYGLIITKRD